MRILPTVVPMVSMAFLALSPPGLNPDLQLSTSAVRLTILLPSTQLFPIHLVRYTF